MPPANRSWAPASRKSRSISCSATGGDYYVFISLPDESNGQLSVVVGDVTGHGIEAALPMTTARALMRSRARMPGSMSRIIDDVIDHLTKALSESGRFITLFLLTVDPLTCSLHWIRAGQDPAICYDPATGTFEELRGSGLALGVDMNGNYEENRKIALSDDPIIFLGPDGIWETHAPREHVRQKAGAGNHSQTRR